MIKELASKDIQEFINQNPKSVLIDVRTEYEWDNVGKPNGKKINLETFFLSIKNNSGEINESFLHDFEKLNISKDTEILVICKSGARSSFVSNCFSNMIFMVCTISDNDYLPYNLQYSSSREVFFHY